jgi:hypothetical protein
LALQRDEGALALDRDDDVAMVVVGLDLKRDQLAVGGEHRINGKQVLADASGLHIAESRHGRSLAPG